jgi:formylglycine-generating enzyme required for sulfatase activity
MDPSATKTLDSPCAGGAPETWAPPDVLDEFRVVGRLGSGGMGVVYRAHDTVLDRDVAIKLVADAEHDEHARRRFLVEARAVARLSHPNVVAVHRVGEVQGRPYLVSELVQGTPLDAIERPVPWRRLLPIAAGLARALAAAHRSGVLHRDVKPANAVVTAGGEVKLLDFGLALLRDTLAAGVGRREIAGTPRYMAPEVLAGEPATAASDLFGLGATLHELAAPPAAGPPPWRRGAGLAESAPGVDAGFARAVDRCTRPDPADRFASAEALIEALAQLEPARGAALAAGESPYRGLQPFEAAHRAVFHGRDVEIRTVLERLATEPLLVVAGDSGVGKSSLCRAGVLPRLDAGAIGAEGEVLLVTLVPGRHPLRALAAALCARLGEDEAALVARLGEDPLHLGRALREAARRRQGTVLFVDQLEELCTLADPDEAGRFAECVGGLAAPGPGLRVLATVRGDFVTRMAALPGLGGLFPRALFLLRPLSSEGIRDAIVGPARALDVRFEDEALVTALAEEGAQGGGLPLLQFALAELWEARDRDRGVIPRAALDARGGVAGALARHADGVLAALAPAERAAARRLLLRLVTGEGTRARAPLGDLAGGDAAARAALEALVRGRLVVARRAEGEDAADEGGYEVAHEALLDRWDTLRGWLAGDAERRAVRDRLARAAGEWKRLGEPREGLWTGRVLAEAADLPREELSAGERAFLDVSRRAERRGRLVRIGAAAIVPLIAAAVWGATTLSARRALDRLVAADLAQAEAAIAAARREAPEAEALRREAFAAYDGGKWDDGERVWTRALEAAGRVDAAWGEAGRALEAAALRDGRRRDVRRSFAEVLYERALLADRDHHPRERDEHLRRLAAYDDGGELARRFAAPAHLAVESAPAGARVSLGRYLDEGGTRRLDPLPDLGTAPLADATLAPGSYRLSLRVPGRPEVLYPVVLARDERLAVTVPIPERVPDGYVYVPPGRFLIGADDDERLRRELEIRPLGEARTDGFLIGRTEVTYADWIAFLSALPADERAARRPHVRDFTYGGVDLAEEPGGGLVLKIQPAGQAYTVRGGEPLRYPHRTRRAVQDWMRLPVSAVSLDDARAYAGWLDRTGRLPRARLCTREEWERAARGADDRTYPSGDHLAADDADFDETYGRDPLAFGPDEVGSHPASDSPFGLADMSGNVSEWTVPGSGSGSANPAYSGGSYYDRALVALRVDCPFGTEPGMRVALVGLRVCADGPPAP